MGRANVVAEYDLRRSGPQYHWTLKEGNGEPILSSERYMSKQNAETGIKLCRVISRQDARYDRRTATTGRLYFDLKAANGEVIGTSETYSSAAACEVGIASCMLNGPTAPVQDNT